MWKKAIEIILKQLYGTSSKKLLNQDWDQFRKENGYKKVVLWADEKSCAPMINRFLIDLIISDDFSRKENEIHGIPTASAEILRDLSDRNAVVLLAGSVDLEKTVHRMADMGFSNYFSADIMDRRKTIFHLVKKLRQLIYNLLLWCKSLVKFILDFPYHFFLDKITPQHLRSAFWGNSSHLKNEVVNHASWKDFKSEAAEKDIVIIGLCDAFSEIMRRSPPDLSIKYGIDWSNTQERRTWNLRIASPKALTDLAHRENVVFLIAACYRPRVDMAVDLLREYGIHRYYNYASMECRKIRWRCIRPFYRFLRLRKYLLSRNGFFRNDLLFHIDMLLRLLRLSPRWKKFESVKMLKDSHKRERCFIVGSGPSLTVDDLEKLKGETTFGANRLFQIYSQTDWRATYYSIVDPNAIHDYKKLGYQLEPKNWCTKQVLISESVYQTAPEAFSAPNCVTIPFSFLDHALFANDFRLRYRKNIALGAYNLLSVVNSCINFAHYMGFAEVYLIGVDCNYSLQKQYFTNERSLQGVNLEEATIMNHFMQQGFAFMKKVAEQNHFKIFNATRGGNLEAFERVNLDEIV